jgi:hypothetical protein
MEIFIAIVLITQLVGIPAWLLGCLLAGRAARARGIRWILFAGTVRGSLAGVTVLWLLTMAFPASVGDFGDIPGLGAAIWLGLLGAWLGATTAVAVVLRIRGYLLAGGAATITLAAPAVAYCMLLSQAAGFGENLNTLVMQPSFYTLPFLWSVLLVIWGAWLMLGSRGAKGSRSGA